MKRILIISAHPDDEILGCGATIARLVKEGCLHFSPSSTLSYMTFWLQVRRLVSIGVLCSNPIYMTSWFCGGAIPGEATLYK